MFESYMVFFEPEGKQIQVRDKTPNNVGTKTVVEPKDLFRLVKEDRMAFRRSARFMILPGGSVMVLSPADPEDSVGRPQPVDEFGANAVQTDLFTVSVGQ